MTFDWVWVKQLALVGALGLAWPWVFRGVVAWIVSREGESLPGPRLGTIFLSLGLATLWPLFGEGLFWLLVQAGLPQVARPVAMAAMGGILGGLASLLPYTSRWQCVAGGLVFGLVGGLAYGFLPWPLSALAALTLLGVGPMLGLTSPSRAKWQKMTSGRAVYGFRGRIG
jgi:hypothetical protein